MLWKDFFYFSRSEKRGLLVLLVFVAGVVAGKWIFSPAASQALPLPPENPMTTETPAPAQPVYRPRPAPSPTTGVRTPPKETRTYYAKREMEPAPAARSYPPPVEKFPEGTVIELNEADTTALKHIPGIGSSFAKRITGYRRILGGYHRVEQLQEVYGMYEELYERITPYLKVDPDRIARIAVNSASVDRLKAHPYINFYQAKAIVDLRKKKTRLAGVEEMQLLEEFTDEDWIRLAPYLEF
jgi:competence ComEA-like helix-hairpin-helix protein